MFNKKAKLVNSAMSSYLTFISNNSFTISTAQTGSNKF